MGRQFVKMIESAIKVNTYASKGKHLEYIPVKIANNLLLYR